MGIILTIRKSDKTEKSGWFLKNYNPYSKNELQDILEYIPKDVTKVLTSIPTPFAQIYLYDAAFNYLSHKKSDEIDGDTLYHKMVSQVLDVIEIMFNYNFLKETYEYLIQEWEFGNIENEYEKIKNPGNKLLYKSLKNHLTDLFPKENKDVQKTIYIISLDRKIIGGSSPYTLFFPSADFPENLKLPRPDASGKLFFRDIMPLKERPDRFIKYLYSFFKDDFVANTANSMHRYLENYKNYFPEVEQILLDDYKFFANAENGFTEIKTEEGKSVRILGKEFLSGGQAIIPDLLRIKPTKKEFQYLSKLPIVYPRDRNSMDEKFVVEFEQKMLDTYFEDRILPDLGIKYPCLFLNDFLENYIIEVPYIINEDYFYKPIIINKRGNGEPLDRDYLLPLKPLFFHFFDLEDIERLLKIEVAAETVTVKLTIPTKTRNVEFIKTYTRTKSDNLHEIGQIESYKFNFAMSPTYYYMKKKEINNNYAFMVCDSEERYTNHIQFSFYKYVDLKEDEIREKKDYLFEKLTEDTKNLATVKKMLRKENQEKIKSIHSPLIYYYLLETTNEKGKDAKPDFIQVMVDDIEKIENIIAPRFKKIGHADKPIKIAIDLGTSNTYIAYRLGENEPKDFEITPKNLSTVTFSEFNKSEGLSDFDKYFDSLPIRPLGIDFHIRHKFKPIIIESDEKESAVFTNPFRSVLIEEANTPRASVEYLKTTVVAFGYQRVYIPDEDFSFKCDIKWDTGEEVFRYRRIFINEIVQLVKDFAILNNADLDQFHIVLFYPLSLNVSIRDELKKLWQEALENNFPDMKIEPRHLTESLSPFYYMKAANRIISSELCCNIDIGGGSCDFILFNQKKPALASSTHYGANILWDTKSGEIDAKFHPILERYIIKTKDFWKKNGKHLGELIENFRGRFAGVEREKKYSSVVIPQEFVQFAFFNDRYFNISERLRNDGYFKIIYLFYIGSLIYHLAQILKLKFESRAPSYLTFSGNGALTLYLLELDITKKDSRVLKFVNYIFNRVLNNNSKTNIEILENPKKLTAWGGLYYKENEDLDCEKIVLHGDAELTIYSLLKPNNDIVKNKVKVKEVLNDKVADKFVNNVKNYIKIFTDYAKNSNLKEEFNMIYNPENFVNLNNKLKEIYKKLENNSKEEEELDTPFFFVIMSSVIKELLLIINNSLPKEEKV